MWKKCVFNIRWSLWELLMEWCLLYHEWNTEEENNGYVVFSKEYTRISWAGIFKHAMGARNRVGIGLLYWARICKRLWSPGIDSEESTPPGYVAWRAGTTNRVAVPARQAGNRFLGSLKHLQRPSLARQATYTGGIDSLESILGLLKI
jgi:hypothetical protein